MKTFTHYNWGCPCNGVELLCNRKNIKSKLLLTEEHGIIGHEYLKERAKRAVLYMTTSRIDGNVWCRSCGFTYVAEITNPYYIPKKERDRRNAVQ